MSYFADCLLLFSIYFQSLMVNNFRRLHDFAISNDRQNVRAVPSILYCFPSSSSSSSPFFCAWHVCLYLYYCCDCSFYQTQSNMDDLILWNCIHIFIFYQFPWKFANLNEIPYNQIVLCNHKNKCMCTLVSTLQ